jgi:hypothetical protein
VRTPLPKTLRQTIPLGLLVEGFEKQLLEKPFIDTVIDFSKKRI